MKTIMLVFGTRPEAIKMCPLVKELQSRQGIKTLVCVTGQHKTMLEQVLAAFHVVPDYDLNIMKEKQTLFDITTAVLNGMKGILETVHPDAVLVHGDTSTTFATALAAFYLQIPVGHVEAGLRTYNIYSPYPEEFNREAVSIISSYNFAPTALSRNNLLQEGKEESTIFVTGNTAIDALMTTVRDDYNHPELEWGKDSRLILITAHSYFTGAGSTLYELAVCGVPSISYVLGTDQKLVAEYLHAKGTTYVCGMFQQYDDKEFVQLCKQFFPDKARRSFMSISGQKRISALGAENVAKKLKEQLDTRRKKNEYDFSGCSSSG